MKRMLAFAKRNTLEMLRDPLIYIFCLGFPVVMIVLFRVIGIASGGEAAMFEPLALIPGIMMFSFSFIMLLVSLLVSKDRATAFIVRLYTSPLKPSDFVLGYVLPCFVIGIGQEIICILTGLIVSAASGAAYFGLGAAVLLMLEMLPMLLLNIFLGVLFGCLLNDKAAPGITSVFITAAGILGGAWMPLDIMGGFETFCRFLPFYPSVYIGRVITGATHTLPDASGMPVRYAFDSVAALGIIPIVVFLVVAVVLSIFAFNAKRTGDKK